MEVRFTRSHHGQLKATVDYSFEMPATSPAADGEYRLKLVATKHHDKVIRCTARVVRISPTDNPAIVFEVSEGEYYARTVATSPSKRATQKALRECLAAGMRKIELIQEDARQHYLGVPA